MNKKQILASLQLHIESLCIEFDNGNWPVPVSAPWNKPENIKDVIAIANEIIDNEKNKQFENINKQPGFIVKELTPVSGLPEFLFGILYCDGFSMNLHKESSWLTKAVIDYACMTIPNLQYSTKVLERDIIFIDELENNKSWERYFKNKDVRVMPNYSNVAIVGGHIEDLSVYKLNMASCYGLHAESIKKVFLKTDDGVMAFLDAYSKFVHLNNDHFYFNHYEYNKSQYLINREHFFDTGFSIFKEDSGSLPPISVMHYEKYTDTSTLLKHLKTAEDTGVVYDIVSGDTFKVNDKHSFIARELING
ncbi:hypothetical protein OAO55_00990 [Bacteroidales bacterium]|nr:hypothetical protein [Bacteroidales bacterium]